MSVPSHAWVAQRPLPKAIPWACAIAAVLAVVLSGSPRALLFDAVVAAAAYFALTGWSRVVITVTGRRVRVRDAWYVLPEGTNLPPWHTSDGQNRGLALILIGPNGPLTIGGLGASPVGFSVRRRPIPEVDVTLPRCAFDDLLLDLGIKPDHHPLPAEAPYRALTSVAPKALDPFSHASYTIPLRPAPRQAVGVGLGFVAALLAFVTAFATATGSGAHRIDESMRIASATGAVAWVLAHILAFVERRRERPIKARGAAALGVYEHGLVLTGGGVNPQGIPWCELDLQVAMAGRGEPVLVELRRRIENGHERVVAFFTAGGLPAWVSALDRVRNVSTEGAVVLSEGDGAILFDLLFDRTWSSPGVWDRRRA